LLIAAHQIDWIATLTGPMSLFAPEPSASPRRGQCTGSGNRTLSACKAGRQDTGYPEIAKRAKKEGALILFADEAGIRSDHHAGTTWAPVGQTPVVNVTAAPLPIEHALTN
jgi:hypothetical protein